MVGNVGNRCNLQGDEKMNDRELLELAAKAEGHGVEFDSHSGLTWYDDKYTGLLWNPLHVDGDAFRLMSTLRLSVYDFEGWFAISWSGHAKEVEESVGTDRNAALRRAIVRAAAKIGETIKE